MPYHISQSNWLIIPAFLTVIGGNVSGVAAHTADISDTKLTSITLSPNRSSFPNSHLSQLAQLPNPIIPRTPEPPAPTIPPSQEQPLQPPTPMPPTPQQWPNIPGTIIVKQFVFEGNNTFSVEKLAEATRNFINRQLTFAEVLEAEAVITKLYTDAGYVNSGAVIPVDQEPISPEGAVIKIQIIEGSIEEIRVRGTRQLNPSYVRSRLQLATSRPLNTNSLLRALQLLQLNPLIKNISAELAAGSRPDRSVLEVKVTEADSFDLEFFADNGRSPSVGSFRRGVRINQGNLIGFGDGLEVVYTNTDGSNALDLSYTVPFNPRNGTIRFAGGLTSTNVIEPPFDRADITGDSHYYELSLRQPIIQTPTKEFALGLTVSRQESQTTLFGENYPLSPGADDEGRTRISAVRFVQEWTQRNPREVFAARSQFSLGIGAFDANINKEAPDSRFFAWRGQAQYVRLLAPETLLLLRSDIQLANRALVPLEQFGLGGFRSVRGYRQDALLTDNGLLTSAEVQIPIYRLPRQQGVLQVIPFIDFGMAWNGSGRQNPDPNTLLGVGLEVQWRQGDRFIARFEYSIPLIEVNSSDRTLQEKGLYFSIQYNLF